MWPRLRGARLDPEAGAKAAAGLAVGAGEVDGALVGLPAAEVSIALVSLV